MLSPLHCQFGYRNAVLCQGEFYIAVYSFSLFWCLAETQVKTSALCLDIMAARLNDV